MEQWLGPVVDTAEAKQVLQRETQYPGRIWSVRTDHVAWSPDRSIARDYVVHPGAVGVIALNDRDEVFLIRQYRHPVGMFLFEPPAGLLDVAGEPPLATAKRELLEEAGLQATQWHVLYDSFTTPGGSSEVFRCYLARGVSPAPQGRPLTGEAEEGELPWLWLPLDEAKDLVLAGKLQNPTAVAGILAAWAARAGGWSSLRPADDPWPARTLVCQTDRVFAR